jgi:hypothetical protein
MRNETGFTLVCNTCGASVILIDSEDGCGQFDMIGEDVIEFCATPIDVTIGCDKCNASIYLDMQD